MRASLLLGGAAVALLVAGLAVLLGSDPGRAPEAPAPGPVAVALSRAAQKRTLSDMRTVGLAHLAWLAETGPATGAAPPRQPPLPGEWLLDFSTLPVGRAAALAERLVPRYLAFVPERDGWGHSYDYRQAGSPGPPAGLAIRSPGADGAFSGDRYAAGTFPPDELDQDLVWAGGVFVRAPAAGAEGGR